MALFSEKSRDALMPLLSQYYRLHVRPEQIIVMSDDDVRLWVKKLGATLAPGAGLAQIAKKYPVLYLLPGSSSSPTKRFSFSVVPGGVTEIGYGFQLMSESSEIWRLAQRFMIDASTPFGLSSVQESDDLGELARMHPVIKRMMECAFYDDLPNDEDLASFNSWRRKMFEKPPELYWDSNTCRDYIAGQSHVVRAVSRPIAQQFVDGLLGKSFGKCEDCGNLFFSLKKGSRWCSHQCRHRVGSRRRYQRKP
ncbi:MAG: hypothetical protein NTX57_05815 [Armatimonadetes bacterium]|nr:hypothetical protein [Armatimonadota bacterium]